MTFRSLALAAALLLLAGGVALSQAPSAPPPAPDPDLARTLDGMLGDARPLRYHEALRDHAGRLRISGVWADLSAVERAVRGLAATGGPYAGLTLSGTGTAYDGAESAVTATFTGRVNAEPTGDDMAAALEHLRSRMSGVSADWLRFERPVRGDGGLSVMVDVAVRGPAEATSTFAAKLAEVGTVTQTAPLAQGPGGLSTLSLTVALRIGE